MDRRDKRETWERLKAANPVIPEQVGDWAASAEARALLARASAELGADTAAGSAAARALVPSRARPRHLSRLGWVAGFVALVALTLGIVVGRGWFVAEEAAPVAGLEEGMNRYAAVHFLGFDALSSTLMDAAGFFAPMPTGCAESLGEQYLRLRLTSIGPGGSILTKTELAELAWSHLCAFSSVGPVPLAYLRPGEVAPSVAEAVAGLAAAGVVLCEPGSGEALTDPATLTDLIAVRVLLWQAAEKALSGLQD